MFSAINKFIYAHSVEYLSAHCVDVGAYRFIHILPFNYYLYYREKCIYLLLPKGMESAMHTCMSDGELNTMVAKFTEHGLAYQCTNFNAARIHEIIHARNNLCEKVVLSRSFDVFDIPCILNLCIENGLCCL